MQCPSNKTPGEQRLFIARECMLARVRHLYGWRQLFKAFLGAGLPRNYECSQSHATGLRENPITPGVNVNLDFRFLFLFFTLIWDILGKGIINHYFFRNREADPRKKRLASSSCIGRPFHNL